MSSLQSPLYQIFFIGRNDGQFGLGHTQDLEELTLCPNSSIQHVFAGYKYNLYADANLLNLSSAGFNGYGSCAIGDAATERIKIITPITYFSSNNIKLKQIFVNVNGCCNFFMSDANQLFGCGSKKGNS